MILKKLHANWELKEFVRRTAKKHKLAQSHIVMKISNKPNLNSSLTFFEPLKDENSFSQSGILQSFLGFFNSKKTNTSHSIQDISKDASNKPDDDAHADKQNKDHFVFHYKAKHLTNTSGLASNSTACTIQENSNSFIKIRSYSSKSLNDEVLSRPQQLNIPPLYNPKDQTHGSEVELRKLKNFSTIFKDIPKRITKGSHVYAKGSNSTVSPSMEENDIKQYWMPDKQCHECYECNERFTTFRRRHHCRICGHVFCSRCCYQLVSGEIIGYTGMVRSCTYCYNLVLSYDGNGDHVDGSQGVVSNTEYVGASGGNQERSVGLFLSEVINHSADTPMKQVARTRSLIAAPKFSPIKSEANPIPPMPPHDFTSAFDVFDVAALVSPHNLPSSYESEQVNLARNSLQLHNLWIRLTEAEGGLEFKDHRFRLRKFSNTFSGEELVEWLLSNEVSSTKDQACIIGQALLDAEFIENVVDMKEAKFQEEFLYQPGKNFVDYQKINGNVEVVSDSGQLGIFPSSLRNSFDQTSSIDGDNEPKWVQEITEELEYQISSEEEEETSQSLESFFPSLKPFINENVIHFSDEGSSSPLSGVSLSSYIEIDNQRSVIKYNRRSNVDDGRTRSREQLDLKEPRFLDSSVTEINADYIRGYLSWHGAYSNNLNVNHSVGWRDNDIYNPSISSTAKQTYCKLQKIYFKHSISFLQQLFESRKLEQTWSDIVVKFASRVCESIVPNCDANMDIVHYVHVKKLLDGTPQESRLINGVVFTSNVINSKMKTRIDNPVIMLLATPLEYQRVHKFASLDPVVRQEEEFFKNLTNRIKRRQPDIVISQCGVAHIARQMLHEAGITLVINVKKSVMERLSRSTGSDVARSIDQLKHARLGSCTRFRVFKHCNGRRAFRCSDGPKASQHNDKDGSARSFKTMVHLDGCVPANGCTVLLRSSPDYDGSEVDADADVRSSLSRVKSVFLQLVRIFYHCRLELSYLMDQQNLSCTSLSNSSKPRSKTEPLSAGRELLDVALQILERSSETSNSHDRADTLSSQLSDAHTLTSEPNNDEDVADVLTTSERFLLPASLSMPSDRAFVDSICEDRDDDPYFSFRATILNSSPFIPTNLPFLFTDRGKSSPLSAYLPSLLYWSEKFPDSAIPNENDANEIRHFHPTTDRPIIDYDTTIKGSTDLLAESMWETSTPNHFDEPSASNDDEDASQESSGSDNSFKFYASHRSTRGSSFSSQSNFSIHDGPNVASVSNKETKEAGSAKEENEVKEKSCLSENAQWLPEKHPFLSSRLSYPANSKQMQDMLADFRANGSSLHLIKHRSVPSLKPLPGSTRYRKKKAKETKANKPFDCLALSHHQHIHVLFSSYSLQSPNAPYPCVIPWAINIDFYRRNDITLAGFLERYCFRPSYRCPNPSCDRAMVEHIRSFVHGSTCMNIMLKELSKPVTSSDILTWCWNPDSRSSTDLKALSHDARSMSFAKFLQLRLSTFSFSKDDDRRFSNELEIPVFKSYQYFLCRDIVASFKCFEINVFDIALPPLTIKFYGKTTWMKIDEAPPDSCPQYHSLVDCMNFLSRIGYERMDAVQDMIMTTRSNHPFEQISEQSEWSEDVSSLKSKRESHFEHLLAVYHEEKRLLRGCIDNIHLEVQSLRINYNRHDDSESGDWSILSESEVEHSESNSPSASTTDTTPCAVLIDEMSLDKLSLKFLELKCLICRLIDVWNTRVADVFDQDRHSRRGNRSLNSELYVKQPQALETSLTSKEGKTKSASSFTFAVETQMTAPNLDNIPDVVTSTRQSFDELAATQISQDDSIKEAIEVPKLTSISTSKETLPVSIPDRAVERPASSGVKKFSKTSSAKNVKSLVSQFLSNSMQTQVQNPFPANEHYLLEHCASSGVLVFVKVRDDEPSSIIAYALKSPEYQRHIESTDPGSLLSSDTDSTFNVKLFRPVFTDDETVDEKEAEHGADVPKVAFKGAFKAPASKSSLTVPKPTSSTGSSPIPSPPLSPSQISPHVEVQFKDSTTKFYCKIYFASRFRALRQQILGGKEQSYIASLSRCGRWAARGGKSGSAFHKSSDDRFVLKQMSRFEMQSFIDVAYDYFNYVTDATVNKKPTALSKILGVYRVSFRCTPGRSFKQDILVMENLFYRRNVQQVFDLKGSVRNRHVKEASSSAAPSSLDTDATAEVSSANKSDLVLLDENLLSIMRDRPLYVHEHSKAIIKRALSNDAKFLSSHLIIDYSLLVGVDTDRQEIVVGIIDYLRTFTWDKKLEMVVKSYGMIGRHGARAMPTVVSPELYRTRFCEAMDRYFQLVPDRWYGMQAYKEKKHDE